MAPKERILRFPQSRRKSAFVLVQAVSTGDHLLDLDLVGTDGFSPFVVSLRESRVSRLKHSCSDDEWLDILKTVLYQEAKDGVQATAKVESSQLTIELRRMAAGMTKHLGDIVLPLKQEQQVDVVGWCGASVLAFEESHQELAKQKAKAQTLEKEVDELRAQLNELIEAKRSDESELMEKFRDLLNEKKVKIREQQRILATASVDPEKLATSQASSQRAMKGHTPVASRRSKRKAAAVPNDESDDGFEKMDVDKVKKESPPDSEDERTTDAGSNDDDATASEDDDEEEAGAGSSAVSRTVPPKVARPSKSAAKPVEAPPTKRELPFATKKSKAPPPKPAAAAAPGSETESDDEL